MANATRLIKKYPNRRLYDTQTSAYITLSDTGRLGTMQWPTPGLKLEYE